MGLWKKNENINEEEVDLKAKIKRFFIKAVIISAVGLIYAGIGFLIANQIASRNGYKLQDAVFGAGCLIVVLGLFLMMHGSSSDNGLSSMGARSSMAANHWLLQTILQERESSGNDDGSRKYPIIEFAFNRYSFLLSGIFLAAFSIFFL